MSDFLNNNWPTRAPLFVISGSSTLRLNGLEAEVAVLLNMEGMNVQIYRVRNWAKCNAALIARGDVTMWIEEGVLQASPETGSPKRGRPRAYSDAAIQMLLGFKQVFRLPMRALQGFSHSTLRLAFADLPVPNDTTLSRRAQGLEAVLPVQRTR